MSYKRMAKQKCKLKIETANENVKSSSQFEYGVAFDVVDYCVHDFTLGIKDSCAVLSDLAGISQPMTLLAQF